MMNVSRIDDTDIRLNIQRLRSTSCRSDLQHNSWLMTKIAEERANNGKHNVIYMYVYIYKTYMNLFPLGS